MKIILSHDVDHLYWSDHYLKDMTLPFTLYRNSMGFIKKQISPHLLLTRLRMVGRMHRIPELIDFYRNNSLQACFFFGMDNALRLSYNYKKTKPLVRLAIDEGHDVGVHGIEVRNKQGVLKEYNRFKEISGLGDFGIRTHYLRLSGYSFELFKETGYLFDSSIQDAFNPCKIAGLWQFPIGIMDASLVPQASLNQNLDLWKKNTLQKLDQAKKQNIDVFVINFHDVYFNEEKYPVIFEWYNWLIDYLLKEDYKFTTFKEYVNRLNI